MNVRKTSETTLSLVVLLIGLYILFPIIMRELPNEIVYTVLGRFNSQIYSTEFYPAIVKFAFYTIFAVGILDAILCHRVAFRLFASLNISIVLGVAIIVTTLMPIPNPYIFWAVIQVVAIIGVYWTFRKLIHNNHSGGQKMIAFIKTIKAGAERNNNTHISDHYTVFGVSVFLIGLYSALVVSLLVFVVTHRTMFV
ncbi:MAG: hypothetical protein LBU77_01755 [Clostridiales bacterium]|jgi:hypothetical protein|nr:hypothetical protein [Clostridiales bacterium]